MTITNLADYLISIDSLDIYLIRNVRFGLLTCEQLIFNECRRGTHNIDSTAYSRINADNF